MPEVVAELPTAQDVPPVPPELETATNAARCPSLRGKRGKCAICLHDLAVAAWRELWVSGKSWLSVQRDSRILRRLCLAYVEEAHLRAALAMDGPFVPGQRGGLVAHPGVAMLRKLEEQITKLEGLLGFNPSDGGRLGIRASKQSKSAVEAFIEQRLKAREERTVRAAARVS